MSTSGDVISPWISKGMSMRGIVSRTLSTAAMDITSCWEFVVARAG
ncbi:MAG: hypothetical protein ACI9KE_006180 [Polyangiales bacterium]|jgi:hypothetical protein